jgi:hypothetical protein
MISEHRKYLRELEAKENKFQTIFNNGLVVVNPNKYTVDNYDFDLEDAKKILICPFCLQSNILEKFVIHNPIKSKNVIDHYLAKCSNCQNKMRWKTLFDMLKWNACQFADFVYNYHHEFWNKVPDFNNWKLRLKNLNMSYDFWQRFNELKGEYIEEE